MQKVKSCQIKYEASDQQRTLEENAAREMKCVTSFGLPSFFSSECFLLNLSGNVKEITGFMLCVLATPIN